MRTIFRLECGTVFNSIVDMIATFVFRINAVSLKCLIHVGWINLCAFICVTTHLWNGYPATNSRCGNAGASGCDALLFRGGCRHGGCRHGGCFIGIVPIFKGFGQAGLLPNCVIKQVVIARTAVSCASGAGCIACWRCCHWMWHPFQFLQRESFYHRRIGINDDL